MRITEMVESREKKGLSLGDRIRYNVHLAICKACRSYERQSALIGKALSRLSSPSTKSSISMDEKSKQRILEIIKKSQN